MKFQLLIIDAQNDFCDPHGALFVNGADKDMERLSTFIDTHGDRFDDIHLTLDSHHLIDVGHPMFWVNSKNEHPNPFIIISRSDVKEGRWVPIIPAWTSRMLDYTQSLEDNKRYLLCIWPEHCLIGTYGYSFVPVINKSVRDWERRNIAQAHFVTKGSNIFTEHYSAVQADVPDPLDPTTSLNIQLIETLRDSDRVCIAGEALSHCVANTVRDIATQFGDEVKKIVIFEDCMSNVPSFETLGEEFLHDIVQLGATVTTSDKFF